MPELPEVETVRRGLESQVSGKKIKEVDVLWPAIIASPAVDEFKKSLQNQGILRVGRRGKFLLFYLSDGTLISHLRMEGKYILVKASESLDKHTHVVFRLEGDEELRYLDVRKFGRMSLVARGEEDGHPSLKKLGPEPTYDAFDYFYMKERLTKHKKSIKALLLDQSLVAGIGNIYADEVLFEAGILPERPASSIEETEAVRLYESIVTKMEAAVKAGGTTIRTYENAFGETGHFQNSLHVYGQTGQPCHICGTLIEKTKVAQRGTHFCPQCQH